MQPFSPKFERLWRHELQRVRRPVKIDHIELHRWVELARLHAEQTVQALDKNLTSLQWVCCMCQPRFPFRMVLHKVPNDQVIWNE